MSYGYSSGMLSERVKILNRRKAETSQFGIDGNGIEWDDCGCVWANVSWAKGMRSINAGAIDAYAVVLVRMRWNCCISMRSRIEHDGTTYQILPETFHADKQAGTIQFNAQAIINDQQP